MQITFALDQKKIAVLGRLFVEMRGFKDIEFEMFPFSNKFAVITSILKGYRIKLFPRVPCIFLQFPEKWSQIGHFF